MIDGVEVTHESGGLQCVCLVLYMQTLTEEVQHQSARENQLQVQYSNLLLERDTAYSQLQPAATH